MEQHLTQLIHYINDNKAFLTLASAWLMREGSLITQNEGLVIILKRFFYNPKIDIKENKP